MALSLDELRRLPREDRVRYYEGRAAAGLPLWGEGQARQTPGRAVCVGCRRRLPLKAERVNRKVVDGGRVIHLSQCPDCHGIYGWDWLLRASGPTPSAGRLRT